MHTRGLGFWFVWSVSSCLRPGSCEHHRVSMAVPPAISNATSVGCIGVVRVFARFFCAKVEFMELRPGPRWIRMQRDRGIHHKHDRLERGHRPVRRRSSRPIGRSFRQPRPMSSFRSLLYLKSAGVVSCARVVGRGSGFHIFDQVCTLRNSRAHSARGVVRFFDAIVFS